VDTWADRAAEMEEDDQPEDGYRGSDPDDDHPPRRPAGRSARRTVVGIVAGLGGGRRIGHRISSVRASGDEPKKGGYRYTLSNVKPIRPGKVGAYTLDVPKLWTETIETHRREVRDAILDTTAGLVGERGLLGVTMSQIAEETGIGRATLYKYFPDVEAILLAWHDRQIADHLEYLAEVRDQAVDASERLEAVLQAYGLLSRHSRGHHDAGFAELLHRDERIGRAHRQVHGMIRDLLTTAAKAGTVRDDVPADELAGYCISALSGDGSPRSKAALRRLLSVVLDGLRPPR
jgi:AcrR family transcriptional regulator